MGSKFPEFTRKLCRDSDGVALVEMALSLPLLLLLFLGMIDISRLVATKIDLEQAAQQTTDLVLAIRPNGTNASTYVAEAASASGLPADAVTVAVFLECDGVRQASLTAICADDEQLARYAYVSISDDVETQFNWTGIANLFDRQSRSTTVTVVGDSTVRFQ